MAFELFGYSISKKSDRLEDEDKTRYDLIEPPHNSDGATEIDSAMSPDFSLYNIQSIQLDENYRHENELIYRYRQMSEHPEIDWAISEVSNEAIVDVEDGESVELNLDDAEVSDSVKDKIRNEFEEIMHLLDFETRGEDFFRDWYIDGRIAFHKVIDTKNPKRGLQKIIQLDPTKLKKVRHIERENQGQSQVQTIKRIKEYYVYWNQNQQNSNTSNRKTEQALQLHKDSITYIGSGKFNEDDMMIGHLHKAIRPLNHLKSIEDAVVIHRVSHAPDRRVFYVGTGNMTGKKALQYTRQVMNMHRNKMVYDSKTGEIKSDNKYQAYTENFWMPRPDNGTGTEIDTLQGGQNFDSVNELTWYQQKLFRSLNIPLSRIESGQSGFAFGRPTEISREEVKFSKFISSLRRKFSGVFRDMLKTQLILKGIVTHEEWEKISKNLRFDFRKDNQFTELKDLEMMKERLATMRDLQDYIGTYFSKDWARRNIFQMDDERIKEQDKQIEKERSEESGEDETGFSF